MGQKTGRPGLHRDACAAWLAEVGVYVVEFGVGDQLALLDANLYFILQR